MVNDGKQKTGADSQGKTDAGQGGTRDAIVRRRPLLKAAGAGTGLALTAGCLDSFAGSDGGGRQELDGPLKIGVLAPEPANDPIGASIANGARLAAQQLTENGGVDGYDVEVTVKDTKENPGTGKQKYQEFILDDEVHATTGIFTSEVLLNVLDDIADQGKVHLTTGAATPEASARVHENYDEYKYHFRTGPINAYHLGTNLVDFGEAMFDEMGWEQIAVLVEDYEWTRPVSQALDDQLGDTGVEVVMRERYASGTENFTPIYDEVESTGADAVLTAMAHTGTPAVVQWARQQRGFEFGGIHVPMQLPSYSAATEGACQFGITQNSATPKSEVTEKTVPFANAYQSEFGSAPVYTGYITFDAVKQYAQAVSSAGYVSSDEVVTALEDSSYRGTAGTIEYYGPDHEYAHDVKYGQDTVWPLFQQWQDGSQEVIYPENLATADYASPPWI